MALPYGRGLLGFGVHAADKTTQQSRDREGARTGKTGLTEKTPRAQTTAATHSVTVCLQMALPYGRGSVWGSGFPVDKRSFPLQIKADHAFATDWAAPARA